MYGYYRPRVYPYNLHHSLGNYAHGTHYWHWKNSGFPAGHGSINYPPPAPHYSYTISPVAHTKYVPPSHQVVPKKAIAPSTKEAKESPMKNKWYQYGNAITDGSGNFPDYYNTGY
ncbi:MAG: hypothetical protein LRY73_00220 [Bacillus sp. (in: Bacteria)]|nr:hypothetical protein [Bacillus sp. (in: firmicutes)]